jgi:hypothetical protein
MDTPEFSEYCTRVERLLNDRYGITVVTRDIPDPLTGDLDGLQIHIDYLASPELRLFLLAHLFGHTVQWNLEPSAFDIGKQYKPPVAEELFSAVLAYEREAAEYGLYLLHEAGVTEVDAWFSAYSACDQAYLLDYYRTGEKHDFRGFWRNDVQQLAPKNVPPFTPTRRTFRMDGVVI